MKCKICDVRKPRRYCPATGGEICSLCCGSEREVTLRCPLDCVYLQEAHAREKLEAIPDDQLPSPDIRITDDFIEKHMPLMDTIGTILCDAALAEFGAVDTDIQEALDAITRTWRTLESGLYYETRPANPIAARIQRQVQEEIATLRKELASKGVPAIPDATFLGILVFFHRMSVEFDNHRRYGRSFLGSFGAPQTREPGSTPLILPA
ncbi:MAG: hypothetical protein ABSH47_17840 [Bryobacteraceae bacterium]